MSEPRVVVAQLGARRHYAVPRILHEAGMLERFFTDSYSGNKPVLRGMVSAVDGIWSSDAAKRWLARAEPSLPADKVIAFERLGFAYARGRRHVRATTAKYALFERIATDFNAEILRHGLGAADTVLGFNRAGLELFKAARYEGRRCVLDQTMAPSGVARRLLREELDRWPAWQPGLEIDALAVDREQREWAAVDKILCPSAFVLNAVVASGGSPHKCLLVPYGTDPARFPQRETHEPPLDRPLRVLFAGEVGLRKGVPYLLEALRQLGPRAVEGRLVGPIVLSRRKIAQYASVATCMGAVPRPEMQAHYAWADVFVFPSVCEGSAAVLSEALASGLPVICTPNSGPPPALDGVRVVPVGDVEALTAAIMGVRDDYAAAVPSHSVDPAFGIAAYGNRLLDALLENGTDSVFTREADPRAS